MRGATFFEIDRFFLRGESRIFEDFHDGGNLEDAFFSADEIADFADVDRNHENGVVSRSSVILIRKMDLKRRGVFGGFHARRSKGPIPLSRNSVLSRSHTGRRERSVGAPPMHMHTIVAAFGVASDRAPDVIILSRFDRRGESPSAPHSLRRFVDDNAQGLLP